MGFTSSLEENSGILTLLVVTSSDTDRGAGVFLGRMERQMDLPKK